jgi:DinB superfamily
MDQILDVEGFSLAPESLRMLEYLKTRADELSVAEIRERVRAAAQELENGVAAVSGAEARLRPVEGKWTIAEVVDHIAQTQVRGAEELRHLLAGRRPPHPPVYEALRSGAGQWAPWDLLTQELGAANRAMIELLEGAPEDPRPGAPTVKTVMVTLRKRDDGETAPQIYFAELGWKEYALLQRLHLLDHRTQVKKLHAASKAAATPKNG